jgi:hypothetical protein
MELNECYYSSELLLLSLMPMDLFSLQRVMLVTRTMLSDSACWPSQRPTDSAPNDSMVEEEVAHQLMGMPGLLVIETWLKSRQI